MFTAALFKIAKTWKQPKCPSTNEWIKMRYMHTMDCYSTSRDIPLPTKVCLVKAMVFAVVVYGCESWTTKKAEC